MENELAPWDRQPRETSKAYAAFVIYRDMGTDRTVRSVAEALNKSGTLIAGWSGKHNWVARAAAWDSMPGRMVAEAFEERAKRIAEQHDRIASKLLDRMEQNLDLLPAGADPTIRWSTAVGVAQKSHVLATDLARPRDTAREEISKKIAEVIERLAGE
jgi:hypothetical protein